MDGIKNEIKTINGAKKSQYGNDFMEMYFDTDDDWPLWIFMNIYTGEKCQRYIQIYVQ